MCVCCPTAKLLEEKCDFQRCMANNEAKLRENESDLRAAQKNFVDKLDAANETYSRNRCALRARAERALASRCAPTAVTTVNARAQSRLCQRAAILKSKTGGPVG